MNACDETHFDQFMRLADALCAHDAVPESSGAKRLAFHDMTYGSVACRVGGLYDDGRWVPVGVIGYSRVGENGLDILRERFLGPYHPGDPVLFVAGLYLNRSLRGRGFGQQLLMGLMELFPGVWLFGVSVGEDSPRAINSLGRKGLAEVWWSGQDGFNIVRKRGFEPSTN